MATITVTNSATGSGSLRAAITPANALARSDTIVFDPPFLPGGAANFRLTSGVIAISNTTKRPLRSERPQARRTPVEISDQRGCAGEIGCATAAATAAAKAQPCLPAHDSRH